MLHLNYSEMTDQQNTAIMKKTSVEPVTGHFMLMLN